MKRIKQLYEKRGKLKTSLRWLAEQSRDVWGYTIVFFLISLFSMLFSLASPVASKYVVDAAVGEAKEFRPEYALIMLGASLISILFGAVSSLFSSYVNEKFAFNVRARMFDRAQRGAWKNISLFHSGDMLARLTSDVDTVAANIVSLLPGILITAIQLIIVLVILLGADPVLALIGLIVGPIGMAAGLFLNKSYRKYQRALSETQSEYYTFFGETLGSPDVIKAFQMEGRNNAYFASLRERRMKIVMKSTRLSTFMMSAARLIYGIGYVAAFCWCATRIGSTPDYTYGTMTLFLSLVSLLQSSVNALGGVVPRLFSMLVSADRIREITEQPTEEPCLLSDIPHSVGLSLRNVSFSYDGTEVLKNLCADIAPNERVGIVGASGVGKTTLIRLLLALITPTEGTLAYTYDGKEEPISPSARRFLSYVPQGNTLLSGSVRDNLLAAVPEADENAMWQALEKAGIADFIRENEHGLDMPIRERSGGLSAGQAQRICIARALLRDRPVLILDEATSALDEETERAIFQTVASEKERTCFIITHRRSMLRYCTSVLQFSDDGSVTYRKISPTEI